jgi:hypothetical protein
MANKLPDDTYDIPSSMPRGENRKRCPNGFRWDKTQELCIGKTTINVVENLEDIKIKSDKNTMSLESLDENNGIFKFYSKGVLIEQKRIDQKMIQKIKLKKRMMFKKIINISKKINKNPNIINNDKELQKQILKMKKMYKKNRTRKSGGKNSEKPENSEIVGTDLIIQESISDKLEDKELNEHILNLTKLVEMNEYEKENNKNKESYDWMVKSVEFMNLAYYFLIMPYEWYTTWSAIAFTATPCDQPDENMAWKNDNSVNTLTPDFVSGYYNIDGIFFNLPFDPSTGDIDAFNGIIAQLEKGGDMSLLSKLQNSCTSFTADVGCLMALQPIWGYLSKHLVCQNTTTGAAEPFSLTEIGTGLSSATTSFYMFDIFGSITLGIMNVLNMFIDNEALKTTTTVSQYIYYLTTIVGFTFFGIGAWYNMILLGIRIMIQTTPIVFEWKRQRTITTTDKRIETERQNIEKIVNKLSISSDDDLKDSVIPQEVGEVVIDTILSF